MIMPLDLQNLKCVLSDSVRKVSKLLDYSESVSLETGMMSHFSLRHIGGVRRIPKMLRKFA